MQGEHFVLAQLPLLAVSWPFYFQIGRERKLIVNKACHKCMQI